MTNTKFETLKKSIQHLELKEQLKRLTIAKTDYQQSKAGTLTIYFEETFEEVCSLEITKIKELIKIDKM